MFCQGRSRGGAFALAAVALAAAAASARPDAPERDSAAISDDDFAAAAEKKPPPAAVPAAAVTTPAKPRPAAASPAPDRSAAAPAPAPAPPARAPAAPAPPASAPAPAPAPPAAAVSPVEASARGIVLPSEKSGDVFTHWNLRREYLKERDERRAEDEEGRVRQIKDELSIDNLFSVGEALTLEADGALAAGSPDQAQKRCQLAVELAPDLAAAHACLARSTFALDKSAVVPAARELGAWALATASDPRLRRAWLTNLGSALLLGALATGLCFLVLVFFRYAKLYAHDLQHLLPLGTRPWQIRALALVVLVSPLALGLGPLALVFTALAACILYLSDAETGLAAVFVALVAAVPFATAGLASVAAFGGPAADIYQLERGEGPSAVVARLQKRLEAAPDASIAFALARKAKREGDLAAAEPLYRRAIELGGSGAASARNNLGNVYLLLGETAKAEAQYNQAILEQDELMAPHFNLARALAVGGVESLERVQSEQARALDLDRRGVEAFGLQVNHKSNRFAIDVPLPLSALGPLWEQEARAAGPASDEIAGKLLSGRLPALAAWLVPAVAFLVFAGLRFTRAKISPCSRCDRCGREVCSRCDADARPLESLCAQCVNVFIRRVNVDASERLKKEAAVERFKVRQSALVTVLSALAGASHVMLGYSIRGFVFLLLTAWLVAGLLLWRGVVHDPLPLGRGISALRIALTAVGLGIVYLLCLRDLAAWRRSEGL